MNTRNIHDKKSHSKSHDASEQVVDREKRSTLKTLSAATGVAATGVAATTSITGTAMADYSADALIAQMAEAMAESEPQISINIQMNRDGFEDWVLIENLTEEPLQLRSFAPRYVSYNQKVLDLDALLSRQQQSKKQLGISPSYAWTHSVRGATRTRHPLRPSSEPMLTADMNQSSRSLQLKARVDAEGAVHLVG